MFWVLAVLLALLSGAFLLIAMRGGPGGAGRAEGALAVYRDQLAEIERDRARGLIAEAEAEAATVEVQRRMLRAGRRLGDAGRRTSRLPTLAAAVLVPLAGVGLYAATGSPGVPSVSLAEQADAREQARQVDTAAAQLNARIRAAGDEASLEDRVALSQLLSSAGRMGEAADALAPVIETSGVPSGVLTLWIEARIAADRGEVSPRVRQAIDRAIRNDPLNPAASYYLAYALETEGDLPRAREVLIRRLSVEPAPPPWAGSFMSGIDRIGGLIGEPTPSIGDIIASAPETLRLRGPSAEEVTAAEEMSPEDRSDMIRGMVDRLASRLEDEPEDAMGWLQLARARSVLGEGEAAQAALARASALAEARPGDAALRDAVEALRGEIGG